MGKPGQFVLLNKKNVENLSKVSNKSKPKSKKKNNQQTNPKNANQNKNTVKNVEKQKQKQNVPPKNVAKNPTQSKSNEKKKKNASADANFHGDLADRLKASRFRYINELLYTHGSGEATEIMTQDADAFTTYHEGYRKQVEQWPLNPLDRIIKSIKAL